MITTALLVLLHVVPAQNRYLSQIVNPSFTGGRVGGSKGICAKAPTLDEPPNDLALRPAACYSAGSQTASNLILAGGIDEKYVTVTDYTVASGDTATVTVNGADTVLTEGTDWDCVTSNDVCAANLAYAIRNATSLQAWAVSAVVYVPPHDCTTYSLSLAVADGGVDGAFGTATNGVDGIVSIDSDMSIGDNQLRLNTGVYLSSPAANQLKLFIGGAESLFATSATIQIYDKVDLFNTYLYSSTRMLPAGGDMTSSHGYGTGAFGVANELEVDGVAALDGGILLPDYTVCIDMEAGSATLPPTGPTVAVNGSVGGLLFDADAEQAYVHKEIPSCWTASSDIAFKVYWTNQSGDALLDTETVKWDFEYRSILWGTESASNGTAVTATTTYTQSGAGADGDTHETIITLDYDSGNQPLSVGDQITGQFDRDVSADTYSGGGLVAKWEICFTSNTPECDHY